MGFLAMQEAYTLEKQGPPDFDWLTKIGAIHARVRASLQQPALFLPLGVHQRVAECDNLPRVWAALPTPLWDFAYSTPPRPPFTQR